MAKGDSLARSLQAAWNGSDPNATALAAVGGPTNRAEGRLASSLNRSGLSDGRTVSGNWKQKPYSTLECRARGADGQLVCDRPKNPVAVGLALYLFEQRTGAPPPPATSRRRHGSRYRATDAAPMLARGFSGGQALLNDPHCGAVQPAPILWWQHETVAGPRRGHSQR